MANLTGFDASEVGDQEDFEYPVIPENDYIVIITASEMKPTKGGNGEYLQLSLEVIDGSYKGTKLIDRLNLNNPNPQAVDIATRALGAICKSVGVIKPNDSTELHNKPLVAKVVIGADSRGRETNEIKKYTAVPAGGVVQQQAATNVKTGVFGANNTAAAAANTATVAKTTPPWGKKQ